MTSIVLAGFLYTFRKDRRDLLATGSLYLLLIAPAAMIYGFADPEVRRSLSLARSVTENNCWAISLSVLLMFFTASSCFFQNQIAQRLIRLASALLWTVVIALPLFFIGYWLSHGTLLSPDIIIALWQTNPAEAIEYVSFKGNTLIAVLIASAVFLGTVCIRTMTCRQSLGIYNKAIPIITVLMLSCSIYSAFKTAGNATVGIITSAFDKVHELDTFKKQLEQRKTLVASLANISQQGRNGLFVIVIGESQSRDRMSAYGYGRDTTPWLLQNRSDKHFVLMNNAYSCYPNTVRALEQALSARSQFSSRKLADSPSIVEIAKAAGYEISWISNQNMLGIWDTPTTVMANEADHLVWMNQTVGRKIQSAHFDDILADELKKIPVKPEAKQLVILHALGCHANYHSRYPSSFDIWPGKDGSYDNAVRFSDEVTRQIYAAVKDRPDFQVLVFMSDHGEDPKFGHTIDPFTWPMVRIPLWAAFSDAFGETAPEVVNNFRNNANQPFTNDMFFDLACGILNVKTHPFYDKNNDPTSFDYSRSIEMLTTVEGKFRIADDPKMVAK